MRNLWLVAKHEYVNTVVRRGFLIGTLAIPLAIVALIGLIILVEGRGGSDLPIGYVDHSGLLDASRQRALSDAEKRIEIWAFADQEAGIAALEREEIQALFVIPAEYPQRLNTDLYYLEQPPKNDAWSDFDDFVRINLLTSVPDELRQRVLEGTDITVYDTVSNREFSESNVLSLVLPFVAAFFFFFATMVGAGYMLGIVANEKENRTMEIMVTTVTPGQLIGGKAVGLLAATLTQLGLYVVAAVLGIIVAARYVPELQHATVPWNFVGLMVLFFIPAYALMGALMIAIGSSVTELEQGQQVAGLLNLVFMLPIFLLPILFRNPGHPLMVFMTLFPTSSFLTVALRWGLGTVPLWQVALGWVLLVASAVFMLWAAAKIFRAGMLRYGQPLNFKAAVEAIRAR